MIPVVIAVRAETVQALAGAEREIRNTGELRLERQRRFHVNGTGGAAESDRIAQNRTERVRVTEFVDSDGRIVAVPRTIRFFPGELL